MDDTVRTTAYGDHPDQVVDLWIPDSPTPGAPAVALVHGGFWYARYGRDLMESLAADLVARGHPVANLEYRRLGNGGGWPATFEDVARAFDHLAEVPLDRSEGLVAIGHSAGGHLALWAAARARLPSDRVGADPRVRPTAVISIAGVCDLRAAARDGLGADAVVKLLGGPLAEVPERVRVAAPIAALPLQVPLVLVHGRGDELVPPSQSSSFARLARASGDRVEEVLVEGDHFGPLDPTSDAWGAAVDHLGRLGGAAAG